MCMYSVNDPDTNALPEPTPCGGTHSPRKPAHWRGAQWTQWMLGICVNIGLMITVFIIW
jgi:hypothetical protein